MDAPTVATALRRANVFCVFMVFVCRAGHEELSTEWDEAGDDVDEDDDDDDHNNDYDAKVDINAEMKANGQLADYGRTGFDENVGSAVNHSDDCADEGDSVEMQQHADEGGSGAAAAARLLLDLLVGGETACLELLVELLRLVPERTRDWLAAGRAVDSVLAMRGAERTATEALAATADALRRLGGGGDDEAAPMRRPAGLPFRAGPLIRRLDAAVAAIVAARRA
ncbi:hypothetical protein HK405_008971 [Cladochytrium tenue]|nr:hypothetical protein HK405_008971 [Cladochytrium tenue]